MQTPSAPAALGTTHLTLAERILVRQASLRASERFAVAENDLNTLLADLVRTNGDARIAATELPANVIIGLRVAVEDFASSARTIYPSAEAMVVSLKQTVGEVLPQEDARTRDLMHAVAGWAIDAYYDR
jgi:hypothetical protein